MKPHTTLFATSILALALAPALQAHGYAHPPEDPNHPQDQYQPQDQRPYQDQGQYQNHQYPDQRYQNQYQDQNDRYPDAEHIDRVSELAHAIDETATYIHRQFERNNRRPNPAEAQAMEYLHALNDRAAHFHDEVESNQENPRHTVRDFAALEDAFNDAVMALRQTPRRSYVDRGMVRIYTLMNELAGYYGHRTGHYGTWGHPRYDHDRDHRGYHGDNGYDPRRYDNHNDNGYRPPYNR
jgi:hypothetical protein